MQLRLSFGVSLLWWLPAVSSYIIPSGMIPCLDGATIRHERLVAYISVVALSLLTNALHSR